MNAAHKQRLLTAALLLAVLITGLWLGGWVLRILVTIAAVLGLYEFYAMFWPGKNKMGCKILGMITGAAIILAQAYSPFLVIALVPLAFIGMGLVFLRTYGFGTETSPLEFAPILLGVIYIPVILHLALYLTFPEQCIVLLASIATDTGGYYAGSAFGKHKIWPLVSPKKSWEGSIGGFFACIVLCVAVAAIARQIAALELGEVASTGVGLPDISLWSWALIGAFLNIAAQLGDFFESAIKRTMGIKDSGTFLPGHGGILDRIDSLLFVLPTYFFIKEVLVLFL